jgi:hypothetical protein
VRGRGQRRRSAVSPPTPAITTTRTQINGWQQRAGAHLAREQVVQAVDDVPLPHERVGEEVARGITFETECHDQVADGNTRGAILSSGPMHRAGWDDVHGAKVRDACDFLLDSLAPTVRDAVVGQRLGVGGARRQCRFKGRVGAEAWHQDK